MKTQLHALRTGVILLATAALLLAPTAAAARAATPGSPGTGDPFFPLAGNGGYDVQHYGLTLNYRPADRHLSGLAVIRAAATQDLSRFDLDLRGFSVAAVQVNSVAATFTRQGQELVGRPRSRWPRAASST